MRMAEPAEAAAPASSVLLLPLRRDSRCLPDCSRSGSRLSLTCFLFLSPRRAEASFQDLECDTLDW